MIFLTSEEEEGNEIMETERFENTLLLALKMEGRALNQLCGSRTCKSIRKKTLP